MTDLKILANTDRSSWQRVGMIASYYYPIVRSQIIWFPIVSVGVFVIYAILTWADSPIKAATVLGMLEYLMIFAPIVFALRDCRALSLTLPSCGDEKAVVLLFYVLVVVPILVYMPANLLSLLFFGDMSTQSALCRAGVQLDDSMLRVLGIESIISQSAMTLTCLWVVMAARRNRVAKSIIYTLLSSFVLGIIGVGYGFVLAFKLGYEAAMTGVPIQPDVLQPEEAVMMMLPVIKALGWVMLVYMVVALVMSWRSVSRAQL